MKRKIEEKLKFWKNYRNQALLISGARQIGKTYSITKFINENFENVISINFANDPNLINLFVNIEDANNLLLRLSTIAGNKLIPNKTVIFFDKIQLLYRRREELIKQGSLSTESQDLLTVIKPLTQKNEYRFIISGSLLGVTINNVNLYPTGYLDEYKMYPMDFEEFLWAKGVSEDAINYIRKCYENKTIVDEEIHKLFLKYFREYVLIGGMPEAVKAYIESNNLFLVQEALLQIVNKYQNDISTYITDAGYKLRLKEIYKSIPSQLSSKNSRFISSKVLDKNYLKNNKIEDEFLWLTNSGIAIPTYHVNEPIIPLGLSIERKTMKLFSNDVGILISQLVNSNIREKLLNNEKEINYGAPYENVAAQELIAHGFDEELFYYNSKKHGEVDFIITLNNEVVPIEIKSGKIKEHLIYNHYALNNLISKYKYSLALVFGESNVIIENDIIYQLPIYMISFVRKY